MATSPSSFFGVWLHHRHHLISGRACPCSPALRQKLDFSWSRGGSNQRSGPGITGSQSKPPGSVICRLAGARPWWRGCRQGRHHEAEMLPKIRETRRQVMPAIVRLGVTGW